MELTYTSGYRFIHDPKSEFKHIKSGSSAHDYTTVQVLLGGGGSFSADTRRPYFRAIIFLTLTYRRSRQKHVLKVER